MSSSAPNSDLPRGVRLTDAARAGRRFVTSVEATLSSFDDVDWQEFERLVGAGFEAIGYASEATPDGADGGVDLVIERDGERAAVQCKHQARRVGVDVVRQLIGVMQVAGHQSGFLVTSGEFTDEAWAEAQRGNVRLIRGGDTLALVNGAIERGLVVPQLIPPPPPGVPRCPICKQPMVERVASRGAWVGETFWGCPRYPACHGMRRKATLDATRPEPAPATPDSGAQEVAPAVLTTPDFVPSPFADPAHATPSAPVMPAPPRAAERSSSGARNRGGRRGSPAARLVSLVISLIVLALLAWAMVTVLPRIIAGAATAGLKPAASVTTQTTTAKPAPTASRS